MGLDPEIVSDDAAPLWAGAPMSLGNSLSEFNRNIPY